MIDKPKPDAWNYLCCPECGSPRHRVHTSGYHTYRYRGLALPVDRPKVPHIRRQRACADCDARWWTFEISERVLPVLNADMVDVLRRAAADLENLAARIAREDD